MSTEIINRTKVFVKEKLSGDSSGHDWWHIYRVWNMSKKLQEKEGGELLVIEMAALLHDIADWKFNSTDEEGILLIQKWLSQVNLDQSSAQRIIEIIKDVSFKGAGVKDKMVSIEGKIVQDADRLDAIGAIGIARTFAFGGKFGNSMHDPESNAEMHASFKEYKKSNGTTINHFYEKLLLLKDRMNTQTARKIALERHQYMEHFLKQFYNEWDNVK
ncbi:MAG: HD domain-containing protein [Bacteroidetes bacterium]|nr:HD domain-containing protein [Bacteroidota bacterium]